MQTLIQTLQAACKAYAHNPNGANLQNLHAAMQNLQNAQAPVQV